MKGRVQSDLGDIVINPEVISTYAGSVAVECFGIVGMAAVNMKDGLVKILKRDSLKHGINVKIDENRISIDFHVIVAYGINIATIADNLIENVTYKLEEATGMKVDQIRVIVEGVRTID
ncbi:MAG: Asp23/Gls24 family envelope stress response protein [Eubacterium sp.]|nr:Asp23/Gls24 family envelope stress response protein [Eubacterium sp.]